MSNLPNELIDEILTRLPPKSMMRFKSVSHAWNKKLCSIEFVKYHEDRRKKDSKKVMIYKCPYHCKKLWAYSFSLNGGAVKFVPHNLGNCRIVGSCDGLLLLLVSSRSDFKKLCIWNPYTGECRDLLIPGDIYVDLDSRFGFGCASSLDQKNHHNYKVLFIRRKYCDRSPQIKYAVALYTTRTNSCKRLKDIPYEAGDDHLVLLDAKLHFFARKLATKMILAFDIEDEEFKEIPLPDCDDKWWYAMTELNGNLCVVSLKKQYERVWVMKEYGVKESWITMFCFNHHNFPVASKPVHLYENNQMLLYDDSFDNEGYCNLSLISGDDSRCVKTETLVLDGLPRGQYEAVAYEETLLSPNAI